MMEFRQPGEWAAGNPSSENPAAFDTAACEHDWRYDEEESQGPWTGYIERCTKCNAIQQVPL